LVAGEGGGGSVHDPHTNYLDAAEDLALLEKHITKPDRQCDDCHWKHAITVRGLMREAQQLGGGDFAEEVTRDAFELFDAVDDRRRLLALARRLRKKLRGELT
jgi:hypothetical protein